MEHEMKYENNFKINGFGIIKDYTHHRYLPKTYKYVVVLL